jgi:glycosyltransferase involved in cell wall biosynthesis
MAPLISVITVVFNGVTTFEETILSVVNQNFKDFEYIVIDGGSTDGTLDIIKKNQDKISFWVSEPDKGIYDAMNKGIQKARGEYIYFLGADDVFIDEFVLGKTSVFFKNKFNIYYGNVIFKKRNILYDGKFNGFKLVTRNISHQCIFYPKAVFVEFKYNTVYRIFADYDLNLKLFNHKKFQFKYIPLTIALFNDEGASGTNTLDANFEVDRLKIIKANFPYLVYLYRLIRTKFANVLKSR